MSATEDDVADQMPTISSQPPYLPPATPQQALDALFSSQGLMGTLIGPPPQFRGLASGLFGGIPPATAPQGMADNLQGGDDPSSANSNAPASAPADGKTLDPSGFMAALHGLQSNGSSAANSTSSPASPGLGLAGAMKDAGIQSLPGADPRLVNVTTDPKQPTFQTAQGTLIHMNHPAPQTIMPWGANMDDMINFADATGKPGITINGGAEVYKPDGSYYHSASSAHNDNHAIDVADDGGLDEPTVRKAALAAGYTHAMHEVIDGVPHWHLQIGTQGIKAPASRYQLDADTPIPTVNISTSTPPPDLTVPPNIRTWP